MHIDLPPEMTVAGPSRARELADITAEAFANDPVMRFMFGTERAIFSANRVLSRALYAPHGICHIHSAGGATQWMRSDSTANPGTLDMLSLSLGLSRYGSKGALKRAMVGAEIMAANKPKAPHLYLFTIGAVPSARGKGVGKALLAPVLAACDRDKIAVYLENSNPANTGFYSAHGFKAISQFHPGNGAPVMEGMWRDPA